LRLNTLEPSAFDERSFGDSATRESPVRIEFDKVSFGSLSASDTIDYLRMDVGVGLFRLVVTVDPLNGFAPGAVAADFEIRFTGVDGAELIRSNSAWQIDNYTYQETFTVTTPQTYVIEVVNMSGKALSYAAALQGQVAAPPVIRGTPFADSLTGTAGNDSISTEGGDDTVMAGAGNDTIQAFTGRNYLRGEDGNDLILGGSEFDDINGNAGRDSLHGRLGDDWVVGGKDNDTLYGDEGDDLVYGNLGNDVCLGGAGADIVRGGQDDDQLFGGSGADFLSGDRGSDTITGEDGADIFHTFGDAGLDRVTDFSLAQGDRVQVDPGTQYTVVQSGADTVIDMVGGGQMILVGVSMTTLTGAWIFGA
jgi:Ca2+-binding RTX toxin-like protein